MIGDRSRIARAYARKVSRSCVGVPSGRRPWMWPIEAPAEFAALVRSTKERGALLAAHAVYLPTTFEEDPISLDGVEVTRDSKSTVMISSRL